MSFCPRCKNLLNISKNIAKNISIKDTTPSDVSDENEDRVHILVDKIIKNEDIYQKDYDEITLSDIQKHETYKNTTNNNKKKIKDTISGIMNKNTYNDNESYYLCYNCGYNKKIEKTTKLIHRGEFNDANTQTNINYELAINYSKTPCLPRTRNFICPTKTCNTENREAVFFRFPNNSSVYYVCQTCNLYWKGE